MAYIGTLSCSDQLDTHVMDFITRLWPRRHKIVDEEKGLVFSLPMFRHRGGSGTIKIYNVPGVDTRAARTPPCMIRKAVCKKTIRGRRARTTLQIQPVEHRSGR